MISTNAWLDAWLVRRAQGGDKNAFGKLYDRNVGRVFHLLRRLTGNADAAEDLTQETFLAAYGSLSAWRGQGAFATWLCGIATHKYAARQRFTRREPITEPYASDEVATPITAISSDPLAHCTRREAEEALDAAIVSLSDTCREAFVLVRVEGLAYKEAADLLGIPLGTLQSRLNRATGVLRKRLAYLDTNATDFVDSPTPKKASRHVIR